MTFTTPGDEGRLPRSPSLAHPPTSESFDLLDATSQQHHELVLFRDLDGYFSEPETARRALEVARQAREWLGEVDPTHPCENQHQVFRSYKQGMEAILAEYLVRSKAELPVEALWLAAKRKHERGTDVDGSESAAASVTLTHLLASQNPESFLELMRRPVKAPPQSAPRDHAAGGSCGGPFPEERGRVERQAAAHWGSAFAAGVRPGSRRGGGPARRRGDESSSRSWIAGPGTAQQPTTSYALPPPIPAPPAAAEAVASSRPSSLAAAAPAAAPAGCGKKPGKSEGWFANDGCFLLAALCGAKKTAPPGGGEGGWGTRRLDTEDEEEEKEYAPSSLRPELAAAAERTDGRRMLSVGSSEVCSVAERDRSATPGKPQFPLQDGLWGGGGCHDRLLPAQAWFAEADAGGWVSVPATSLGGRSGDMDLGSTFGTDNAVASPRDLLFQSSRDVAFELDQKKSSSNTNSGEGAHGLPLRLSPSSGNSTPHDVDGHGHGHDDYDDDSTSVDSEEIFPEPDPFDPADGGLPCLSRRPLGDWGVDIQGNLRSATGLPAETYFKAGVLSYD